MRTIAAVVLALSLCIVAVFAAVALAQNPDPDQQTPPPKVSVALTTANVRDTAHTRIDLLLLWNRNERALPIGHAIKSCVKAGGGGLLGGGVMTCTMVISLPEGKLIATGQVHNLNRYTLVITGGTGTYLNAKGPLFVSRVADGVRRMVFTL